MSDRQNEAGNQPPPVGGPPGPPDSPVYPVYAGFPPSPRSARLSIPVDLTLQPEHPSGHSYLPWELTDQRGTGKEHNLGRRPAGFIANLVCREAHDGWQINDVVSLPLMSSPHDDDFGVVIYNWDHRTYDWFVHGSSKGGRTGHGPDIPARDSNFVDPAHSDKWEYEIVAIG